MWRLIVTIFVVSNSGGVAVESTHSDWTSQEECNHVIETMYTSPPTADIGGVRLTVRMGARCMPVGPVARAVPLVVPLPRWPPPPPPQPYYPEPEPYYGPPIYKQ